MGQEIEYKLRAADAQELARVYESLCRRFAVGQERVIEMHTRYFDTPERFLREGQYFPCSAERILPFCRDRAAGRDRAGSRSGRNC